MKLFWPYFAFTDFTEDSNVELDTAGMGKHRLLKRHILCRVVQNGTVFGTPELHQILTDFQNYYTSGKLSLRDSILRTL